MKLAGNSDASGTIYLATVKQQIIYTCILQMAMTFNFIFISNRFIEGNGWNWVLNNVTHAYVHTQSQNELWLVNFKKLSCAFLSNEKDVAPWSSIEGRFSFQHNCLTDMNKYS